MNNNQYTYNQPPIVHGMKEPKYSYKNLEAYKESKTLVKQIYELLKKFPREEQFALCDQLRRAVISVPSNLAEGSGRYSVKEQLHFIEIAYGSLLEVNCQMDVAKRLGYIVEEELIEMDQKCVELARMLSGLRASVLQTNS